MSSWRYTFIFLAASTSGSFILSSFLDSLLVVFLSQPPLLNLFIRFAHISSPLVFFLKIPAFNLHSERYQLSYHLHLFHVSSVLNLCSTLFSYIFHNLSFFWNILFRAGWLTSPCATICFHRWMHSSLQEAECSHPGISLLVALTTP